MGSFILTTLNNINLYCKKQWPVVLFFFKEYFGIFLLYCKKQWPVVLFFFKKYLKLFLLYCKNQLVPFLLFIFNYFLFTMLFWCLFFLYTSKASIIKFYNHVINVTAAEAERLEILAKNNIQKQKAPSLLLLKLDFLAFFSILNRVFSLILVIFILYFFSFIFVYNLTILSINSIIFYLFILFVIILVIHIGFSHIKMALIFENFSRLVSNKISNIRKFYFIIYFYLFILSIMFLISLLLFFFKIQIYFTLLKSFYFNSCIGVFLQAFAGDNLAILTFYSFLLYLFLFLFNYLYFCKFLLNYRNYLVIIIKFVCFWKSLIFFVKLYYKYNIHYALRFCPEYVTEWTRDTVSGTYQLRLKINPDLLMYSKVFDYLRTIVGDDSHRLWYLNMDFNKCTAKEIRYNYMVVTEDTYAFIVLRFYRILCLCVQSPKQSRLLVQEANAFRCLWFCLDFLKKKEIIFYKF